MRTIAEVLTARASKEAEARGQATSVLTILTARGVRVDAGARRRIQNCRDPVTLKRWLRRAANATRLADVLDEPAQ